MLYFAYGSNMNRAQMAFRCPTAKAIGPAKLPGWRLIFTREGYSSVFPAPKSEVWGIVWAMAMVDVATLDLYEGVMSRWYDKRWAGVKLADGSLKEALVYVAGPRIREGFRPKRHYFEHLVLQSAIDWGLPEPHLETIRAYRRDGFK